MAVGEAMLELAPVGEGLYRRGFAGDTFNTIWHMAQLMGEDGSARFVTRIGADRLSNRFAEEMEADGLDLGGITRDPERGLGLYLIELDGAERSFHYWRSTSAARHLADDPQAITAAFAGAGLIHVSGISLAILAPEARERLVSALSAARRDGAVVSFDPNIRPQLWATAEEARATVARMLEETDIALPSFDDEATLWSDRAPSDTLARYVAKGVAEIVVKNGAAPVHFHAEGRSALRETSPAASVRDTTGAGDAFNAGYLAARLMGVHAGKAVAAGQSLAAEVIGHFGARIPRERVRGAMRGIFDRARTVG